MGKNKIEIGDKNEIKDSNIAGNNIKIGPSNKEEKHPILNKILIPIVVSVVAGIIVAIIVVCLNLQ